MNSSMQASLLNKGTSTDSAQQARHGRADVVLGAQWGDEGKGKLVDSLTASYAICARVAGGSNAGHTIVVDGCEHKLHLVPSGILQPGVQCIVGNGCVIHVPGLMRELEDLRRAGVKIEGRLLLSDRAHIVFGWHRTIDALNEEARGGDKLGTTGEGVGPSYTSKVVRTGVRLGELRDWDGFEASVRSLAQQCLSSHPKLMLDLDVELAYFRSHRQILLDMTSDTAQYVHNAMARGRDILVEGANAAMLDLDHGTYPFVTSSNPTVGSVCTGLGLPPQAIRSVIGVVKAYTTRVGAGPFPTEDHGKGGASLRQRGAEFGATTGRPRRCGWLDIQQLRYSTSINGFTHLCLTKLDVLSGQPEVPIGVRYLTAAGKAVVGMPSLTSELEAVVVEYEVMPGWPDLSACTTWEQMPPNAQAYVRRVECLVATPVRFVGTGQEREHLLEIPPPESPLPGWWSLLLGSS